MTYFLCGPKMLSGCNLCNTDDDGEIPDTHVYEEIHKATSTYGYSPSAGSRVWPLLFHLVSHDRLCLLLETLHGGGFVYILYVHVDRSGQILW